MVGPDRGRNGIVLFHGYGADAQDLAPLAHYLNGSSDVTWIFPEGPLQVPIGPGFYGRAWFAIDVEALQRAMLTGQPRNLALRRPSGLDHAKAKTKSFLNEVQSRFTNVILGGFSQGAMLATELTFSAEKKPKALVILSGALLDKKNWQELAKTCRDVPFFQSHGQRDPILSFSGAQDLNEVLNEAGMVGEFHQFQGGHEIPPSILQKLAQFLKNQWRS